MIGNKSTTARIEAAAADLAGLRKSVPALDQAWEMALRAGDDAKADDLARQRTKAQESAAELERRLAVLRDLRRDEITKAEREQGKKKATEAEKAAQVIAGRVRDVVQALESAEAVINKACDTELLSAWYGPAGDAQRLLAGLYVPELPHTNEAQQSIERALQRLSGFTSRLADQVHFMRQGGGTDWLAKNVERAESAEWQAIVEKAGLTE